MSAEHKQLPPTIANSNDLDKLDLMLFRKFKLESTSETDESWYTCSQRQEEQQLLELLSNLEKSFKNSGPLDAD